MKDAKKQIEEHVRHIADAQLVAESSLDALAPVILKVTYARATILMGARRVASFSAEDVAQEATIEALRSLPGMRQGAKLVPYIAKIVKNVFSDMMRHYGVEARQRDSVAGELDPAARSTRTALTRLIDSEEKALLDEVLTSLSLQDRTLASGRFEELPFAEIGQTLGLAEEATRQRWRRLRKRLQPVLREVLDLMGDPDNPPMEAGNG